MTILARVRRWCFHLAHGRRGAEVQIPCPPGLVPAVKQRTPAARSNLGSDFHKLWAATTVSLFGDAITGLALPLTAALTLHADALQMGLLTSVGMLPHLFLYLVAGAWVDRGRKRPFMITADLARAALIGAIPLSALLGVLRMQELYLVAFGAGALKVFFDLAYGARVQSLLAPVDRVAANSRLSLSRSVSFVGGPGLGGALVQLLSAPFALAADAASFLASAFFVSWMRASEPVRVSPRSGFWREIGQGIGYAFRHPILRPFYIWTTTMNFFNFAYSAVAILYFVRVLNLPPALIGVPAAFAGVGAIAGSILAPSVSRRLGLGWTAVLGEVTFTAGYLAVPLASGQRAAIVLVLSAGSIVTGLGLMLLDTTASTMFQALVPHDLMARTNAATRQLNWGIRPLGAFVGGLLGQSIGLHSAVWVGTLGALLAASALVLTRVRTYRGDASGP